jgi:biopolymer transport protein TolR
MRKRQYGALSDINVTNLVDVVLVLLIIFMITAPMLQSGIDINLPKTVSSEKDLGEGIVVTITKEKGVFVDDKITPLNKFEQRLAAAKAKKGGKAVYLRADSGVPYGFVVDVMGKIKNMGISDLGLVIEPAGKK